MSTGAAEGKLDETAVQREWWRNVFLVLREPRAVFAAMRDDSDGPAGARQEPVLALVFLSGIAAVLSFSSSSRVLLDDPARDGVLVAVLAFLGGGLYGFAGYWLGGLGLHIGIRGAKGEGSYRQARHVLAYALTPLALSLAVWPVRLAAYGADNFKTGGSDNGPGYWGFTSAALVFLVWALALLVIGVRELHGWSTMRSLVALALTVLALLGLAMVVLVVGG